MFLTSFFHRPDFSYVNIFVSLIEEIIIRKCIAFHCHDIINLLIIKFSNKARSGKSNGYRRGAGIERMNTSMYIGKKNRLYVYIFLLLSIFMCQRNLLNTTMS